MKKLTVGMLGALATVFVASGAGAAELRVVKAIVVIPEAVRADLVETVVASLPQAPRVPEKLAHPPPGNRGILHQTCALLI